MSSAVYIAKSEFGPQRVKRIKRGFTLVELLVVIGIIALLISMLLPALNRARAAANLVACQAQMRQMGQAIHLYANQYKGYLPATDFAANGNNPANPGYIEPLNASGGYAWSYWHLPCVLSRLLGKPDKVGDNFMWLADINPIFSDRDTPPGGWGPNPNHYNFSARLFVDFQGMNDTSTGLPSSGKRYRLVPITKVKKPAEIIAAWDGIVTAPAVYPVGQAFKNNQSIRTETNGWFWYPSWGFDLTQAIAVGIADEKVGYIKDAHGGVDFRHMVGTTTNVMFLDGHVESRKVGELRVRDFCFPWRDYMDSYWYE